MRSNIDVDMFDHIVRADDAGALLEIARRAKTEVVKGVGTITRAASVNAGMDLNPVMVVGFLTMIVLCLAFVIHMWMRNQQDQPRKSQELDTSEAPTIHVEEVHCPDSVCRSLAWWPQSRAADLARAVISPEAIDIVEAPWTARSLSRVLRDHGVPAERWSADAQKYLLDELCAGKGHLTCRATAVRTTDLVLVVVETGGKGVATQVLQLQQVSGRSSRFEALPERTPCTRRARGESAFEAARRCLKDKVKIPPHILKMDQAPLYLPDVQESTKFFPGLQSIVRKCIVRFTVTSTDAAALESAGLRAGLLNVGQLRYTWMPLKEAGILRQHMREEGYAALASPKGVVPGSPKGVVNGSPRGVVPGGLGALLPWTEDDVAAVLAKYLAKGQTSGSRYGMTPMELVMQLNDGRITLGVRQCDGQLLCLQDFVSVHVSLQDGQSSEARAVLVQIADYEAASGAFGKPTLPQARKQSNEHRWATARRICLEQLGLSLPSLHIDESSRVQVKANIHECVSPIRARSKRARTRGMDNFVATEPRSPRGNAGCISREFVVKAYVEDAGSISGLPPPE